MRAVFFVLQAATAFSSAAIGAHLLRAGSYEFAATQFVCTVLMVGLLLKDQRR